jgi:peroxiredoxin Q/BCP
MGVQRSTFLIDPEGVVRRVIPKVKPATHDDEVLAALGELQ